MPFDFYSAYVLTAKDFAPQVVMGVHEHTVPVNGEDHAVLRFLTTNARRPVNLLDGEVSEPAPGTITVKTEDNEYKFEYLTAKKFQELGTAKAIIGWDRLASKFSTDGDVQQFYIHEFLMNYPWYIEEARTS